MSTTRLADLPAATAPPGYTQNLVHPPETKHINAGITLSIVGMTISTLSILLRVYTKAYLSQTFGVDDGELSQPVRGTNTDLCSVAMLSAGVSNSMPPLLPQSY